MKLTRAKVAVSTGILLWVSMVDPTHACFRGTVLLLDDRVGEICAAVCNSVDSLGLQVRAFFQNQSEEGVPDFLGEKLSGRHPCALGL